MKYKIEHKFEGGPFQECKTYLFEEYTFDAVNMPNVQGYKALEAIETDEIKRWKNEWSAHGQIPKVVQHLIKPQMLSWVEETTYDKAKQEYRSKITPFYFQNVFSCENRGYCQKISDREFLRIQEGYVNVKIPILGNVIEDLIVSHMKSNFETEYRDAYQAVKKKFPLTDA